MLADFYDHSHDLIPAVVITPRWPPAANQYVSTGISQTIPPPRSGVVARTPSRRGHRRSGLEAVQRELPESELQGSNWRQCRLHCCGSPPPTLAPTLLSTGGCACAAILFAFSHSLSPSFIPLPVIRSPPSFVHSANPTHLILISSFFYAFSLARKRKKKWKKI